MPEFEIDRKRAVFTYEQFFRRLGRKTKIMIRCPYHEEKTPSLMMYQDKNNGDWKWWCFGCGFGGEVIWEESHIIFKKENK